MEQSISSCNIQTPTTIFLPCFLYLLFRIYYYFNLFFFFAMLSVVVIVVTGTFILFFFCFYYYILTFFLSPIEAIIRTRNSCRYCSSKNKRLKQRTYFIENCCSVFFCNLVKCCSDETSFKLYEV